SEGDKVQLAISTAAGVGNQLVVGPTSTDSHKGLRVAGGIWLGDVTSGLPGDGVIRMKERVAVGGTPPGTTCDFFLVDDGSGQKLYVKFDNGVTRLLASA